MSTGKALRILSTGWYPSRPDECGLRLIIHDLTPEPLDADRSHHPITSPVSNIALAFVKGIILNSVNAYAITIPEMMT